MTKTFIVLFFILFGFVITPSESYACGKLHDNTDKNYIENKSVDSEIKDCCSAENHKTDKKGCDGNCGDSTCHCPSCLLNITMLSYYPIFLLKNTENKKNYSFKETYYSSVFLTIWLPPKIS